MPSYDLEFNGSKYTVQSDHDLSADELGHYATLVRTGKLGGGLPPASAQPTTGGPHAGLSGSLNGAHSDGGGFAPVQPGITPGVALPAGLHSGILATSLAGDAISATFGDPGAAGRLAALPNRQNLKSGQHADAAQGTAANLWNPNDPATRAATERVARQMKSEPMVPPRVPGAPSMDKLKWDHLPFTEQAFEDAKAHGYSYVLHRDPKEIPTGIADAMRQVQGVFGQEKAQVSHANPEELERQWAENPATKGTVQFGRGNPNQGKSLGDHLVDLVREASVPFGGEPKTPVGKALYQQRQKGLPYVEAGARLLGGLIDVPGFAGSVYSGAVDPETRNIPRFAGELARSVDVLGIEGLFNPNAPQIDGPERLTRLANALMLGFGGYHAAKTIGEFYRANIRDFRFRSVTQAALENGVSAADIAEEIGPGGKTAVQHVERSPEFQKAVDTRVAAAEAPEPVTITADDIQRRQFLEKGWRQRTQGLINALTQEIDRVSGGTVRKGQQRQSAASMRKLRSTLRDSLSTNEIHPAILAEMNDLYDQIHTQNEAQLPTGAIVTPAAVSEPPTAAKPVESSPIAKNEITDLEHQVRFETQREAKADHYWKIKFENIAPPGMSGEHYDAYQKYKATYNENETFRNMPLPIEQEAIRATSSAKTGKPFDGVLFRAGDSFNPEQGEFFGATEHSTLPYQENGPVRTRNVRLENPLVVADRADLARQFKSDELMQLLDNADPEAVDQYGKFNELAQKLARDHGHDGIIYKEAGWQLGNPEDRLEIVKFSGKKAAEPIPKAPPSPNESGSVPPITEKSAVTPSSPGNLAGGPSARLPGEEGVKDPAKAAEPTFIPVETTGIAQSLHEARGLDVARGEGVTPEQMVKRGREIEHEADQRLADFETTGRVSGDDIASFRARMETLSRAANNAYRNIREGAGDEATYQAAKQAELDWARQIKPAQTEWHRQGAAMQGQTELDTGNWTELARTRARTARGEGADPTPAEDAAAKAHADKIHRLNEQDARLRKQAQEELVRQNEQPGRQKGKKSTETIPSDAEGIAKYFQDLVEKGTLFDEGTQIKGKQAGAVNPNRPSLSLARRQAIWKYVKQTYIDPAPGQWSLDEMVNAAANDLHLDPDLVLDAIVQPKTAASQLGFEQLRVQNARRDAIKEAKHWAERADDKTGQTVKVLSNLWHGMRALKTLGHGTVWPVTHGAASTFDPVGTAASMRGFVNSWKSIDVAQYERLMSRMEAIPEYGLMRSSGLKIARDYAEDYQGYVKLFGKLGKLGNRQMDMLKVYRAERFMQLWDDVDPRFKGDSKLMKEMGKLVADQVNHESGTVTTDFGAAEKAFRETWFGPNLWRARWARMVGDPIKTVRDLTKGSDAEKAMASYRVKRFARILGTYVGVVLGSNYALFKALGKENKDNVNFFDPAASDWLKPKDLSGNAYDWLGGLLRVPSFLYKQGDTFAQSLVPAWKDVDFLGHVDIRNGDTALSKIGDETWNYVTAGLSPQWQLLAESARGTDYTGRPLPWSDQAKKDKAADRDKDKSALTWDEWLVTHGSPIPIEHVATALYQGFREEGLSGNFAMDLAKAVAVAIVGVHEIPPSRMVKRDAIGRPLTDAARNDPVIKEMKRLGVTPDLEFETGEKVEELGQRRTNFANFAYPEVKAEIDSPAYKDGLTFTQKKEHLKKLLADLLREYNKSGPGAEAHEKRKAAKEEKADAAIESERKAGVR